MLCSYGIHHISTYLFSLLSLLSREFLVLGPWSHPLFRQSPIASVYIRLSERSPKILCYMEDGCCNNQDANTVHSGKARQHAIEN